MERTENIMDMFGQPTISARDVVAWVSTVPAHPPATGSARWVQYVKGWNVLEKIALAKRSGKFAELLDRSPPILAEDVSLAAEALKPIMRAALLRPHNLFTVEIPSTVQRRLDAPATPRPAPASSARIMHRTTIRRPLLVPATSDALPPPATTRRPDNAARL